MKTNYSNSSAVNREIEAAIMNQRVVNNNNTVKRSTTSNENKYVYMVLACTTIIGIVACICGWIPTNF